MDFLHTSDLTHLLATYGYWAVLAIVALESTGLPVPGESMLLAASVYAGTTHRLEIALIIAAAATGAILGDNLGYLVGREGGYRLLDRYGSRIGLDARKRRLTQYLFATHGGKAVFFGRFVAVLRVWAAFLAGANRMSWRRFMVSNAAGGIVWAALMGSTSYTFGAYVTRLGGVIGFATAAAASAMMLVGLLVLRRNEHRLQAKADKVFCAA